MTRLYLLTFISCFCSAFHAQESVFPGDANNNGIVDQYDLLSIGYAFGETGPARIQLGTTDFQGIPAFWDESFPNGTDYIYADCNGNGVVDYLDFLTLFNNFDTVLDNPTPLEIEHGNADFDPSVIWNNGVLEVAVSGGTPLNIPINIPLSDLQTVNGIAFNLYYTSAHFQSAGFTNEEHWLSEDNAAMGLVMTDTPDLMQVAITRFGINPMAGGGNSGVLNLIIIEDMIDYLEAPDDTLITKIYLEDILLIDENFNAIPIASDTFEIKLYHDVTAITATETPNELSANIFPNPSLTSQLNLHCRYAFNDIALIDLMGRMTTLYSGTARKQWESDAMHLNPGLYSIRISGESGVSILKYLVLE